MPKRKGVTKEKGSTKKGLSTRAAASITHSRKSRAFRARPTALGTIEKFRSPRKYMKTEIIFPDTNNFKLVAKGFG